MCSLVLKWVHHTINTALSRYLSIVKNDSQDKNLQVKFSLVLVKGFELLRSDNNSFLIIYWEYEK